MLQLLENYLKLICVFLLKIIKLLDQNSLCFNKVEHNSDFPKKIEEGQKIKGGFIISNIYSNLFYILHCAKFFLCIISFNLHSIPMNKYNHHHHLLRRGLNLRVFKLPNVIEFQHIQNLHLNILTPKLKPLITILLCLPERNKPSL